VSWRLVYAFDPVKSQRVFNHTTVLTSLDGFMIQIFEERFDAFPHRPKPRAHQPNYATGKHHPLNLTNNPAAHHRPSCTTRTIPFPSFKSARSCFLVVVTRLVLKSPLSAYDCQPDSCGFESGVLHFYVSYTAARMLGAIFGI